MSAFLSWIWALIVIFGFIALVLAVPVTYFYYFTKIVDEKRLSLRDLFILVATTAIVCAFIGYALRR